MTLQGDTLHVHEQSRVEEHFSDIERKKEVAESKERRKKKFIIS